MAIRQAVVSIWCDMRLFELSVCVDFKEMLGLWVLVVMVYVPVKGMGMLC